MILKYAYLSQLFLIFCLTGLAQTGSLLTPGIVIKQKLLKNDRQEYILNLKKHDSVELTIMQEGVDLAIDLSGPDNKKIKTFDSPNGTEGPEKIAFRSTRKGLHKLLIYPFKDQDGIEDSLKARWLEINQGNYEINAVKILSKKEANEKLARHKMAVQNTIGWLRQNAQPLRTVVPGGGFDDLAFLKPILKDVRFVGLGEATHGTREFFQMKHRMLEFLVKEMGFTVFAIEGSYAGCMNINDYVLYGKGDAHSALASQGFWVWDTEEVIDMIEWMRSYNQNVPADKKVKFLGFDIQVNAKGGGIQKLRNFLAKVDPELAAEKEPLLRQVSDRDERKQITFNLDSCRQQFSNLISTIIRARGMYVEKSSEEEFEDVLQYATVIDQYNDVYMRVGIDPRKKFREWRDYYMASNLHYLVQHEKPGTKFVLWAHNAHISKNAEATVNRSLKPFGSYLKERYGSSYYAMGFSFSKGSFQVIEYDTLGRSTGKLQEFSVPEAKKTHVDWYMAAANKGNVIINFRNINPPEDVINFMRTERPARDIGSGAIRKDVSNHFANRNIEKDFDAIIFIDNTTRARPTATGMR